MFSFLKKVIATLTLMAGGSAMATISSPSATSDSTNLYYQFTYSGTPKYFRAFLDTDRNSGTGYNFGGIGSNFLLENGNLYRHSGSNGSWGWTFVKLIPMTKSNLTVRWTVSKSDVGSPAGVNLVFQHDNPVATSAVITQTVTTATTNSISLAVAGAPNLPYNGTTTLVKVGFVGATPASVSLARDGLSAFATWPGGTFFTLSSDGKFISGNWCISASCWGNQAGAHVLTATATYADGSQKSASVSLNVSDSTSTTTTTVPAITWTRCASEGGVCSFSGTRQIRYGANGIYSYQTATSSISCSNATFGDPVVGVAKYCDYSSVVQTTVTTTTMRTPTTTTTTLPAPPPPTTTTTTLQVSSGPTYYVSPSGNDANSGTSSSPWRTIQKAADSVSAGATIILMDGTYEQGQIIIRRSGTATAPITFKAQNKWQAIISSTSGCNPGLSVSASYIHLKDFRMNLSPRNIACSFFTSANVDVRAWSSVDATPSNPTTGYVGFRASGLKADPSTRVESIKSNQDFTIIENSEVNRSLELFNSLNSVIRNNVVWTTEANDIPIVVKGGVRNAQIYNNIIHQKAANGSGIIIGGYSCDECHFDRSTNIEAYNSVAYNNVIINESSGAITALQFMGAKDSAFVNNVVINGTLSMTLGGHNTGPQAPTSNPIFKNNIVMCSGRYLTGGWSYSGTLNLDYNAFYNCSGVPSQAHSINGDPMFVNPLSDWRFRAGSPAINSGVPVTMPAYGGGSIDLSRDYNGVIRTTPWDLGIYDVKP